MPYLYAFDGMLNETIYNMYWTPIGWGNLTLCNWPDLTLAEVENMVLNESIFGYDDPGSGVRISITCKDGNGEAYYDSNNWSWVFVY